MSMPVFVCLSVSVFVCLSVCLCVSSVSLPACLSASALPVFLSVRLSVRLCLSRILSASLAIWASIARPHYFVGLSSLSSEADCA